MGSLTPFEALNFASKLKSPELTDAQRTAKVTSLLKSMGLEHVKDSIIGYTGAASRNSGIKRGLSGGPITSPRPLILLTHHFSAGERKRVSICVELVNDPSAPLY